MFKIDMQKKYTSVGLNQVRARMYLKTDYCIVLEVDIKLLSTDHDLFIIQSIS